MFLTDGVGARGDDAAAKGRRAEAASRAARILGAREPKFLGFPDNRLDQIDLLDIVRAVEKRVSDINPLARSTPHHRGDLNIDHTICQRAVMTACRPLPGSPVRRIVAMEIALKHGMGVAGTAQLLSCQRALSIYRATLPSKRQALEAYAEEMRNFPHARSYEALEALARWRGASVGLTAAEAFMVVREIDL